MAQIRIMRIWFKRYPLKLATAFGILVYWAMILALKLSDIANNNLIKLANRKKNNTIMEMTDSASGVYNFEQLGNPYGNEKKN